jgi:hypothetical protein
VFSCDGGDAAEHATANRITLAASVEREQRFPMGSDEYLAWDDGDVRTEWVDGEVIVLGHTLHDALVDLRAPV